MRVLRASLAAFLLLAGLLPSVALAAGVSMTTPYPSGVADPGSTVKFPITVTSDTPQRVELAVTGQPEGWNTRLQGGGSTIAALSTDPAAQNAPRAAPAPTAASNGGFTENVAIPNVSAGGSRQVVLTTTGADGTTTQLALDINVQTGQTGV